MTKDKKNKSSLKNAAEIGLGLAILPVYLTGVAAKKTYDFAKEKNEQRIRKLNKDIREQATLNVKRNLHNFSSKITDKDEIEKLISKEEVKLKDKRITNMQKSALAMTGISALWSPVKMTKTFFGSNSETDDDSDMEA